MTRVREGWDSLRGALGAAAVQSNTITFERMGTIDTEEAARRLARVILSDIDLYMRERPKEGESREAQIEEGRRHFASRVTPELVPLFAAVLADRAAGIVSAPVFPAARPAAASEPAPDVAQLPPSPVPTPALDDEPATEPSILAPPAPDPPPPTQPARISIRRMLDVARRVIAAGIGRLRRRHETGQ